MADLQVTFTIKDSNGNLARFIDNFDDISFFSGRLDIKPIPPGKKEWFKIKMIKFIKQLIRQVEVEKAKENAAIIEISKPDPIIE